MQNLRMYLIIISLLPQLFLQSFVTSCHAGSLANWHVFLNKTAEEVFVTFFEGYPVSRVYSKLVKPGEKFEIDDQIERPSHYFVVSVTRNHGQRDKRIVYWKVFSLLEYSNTVIADKNDGFHITDERLATWEHDP